jgi:hypothetical protein
MANYRYFTDLADGTTVMATRADYSQGERKLPRIYSAEHGGWLQATRVVVRKSNPSMHECDARCMFATGRSMNCECSCGGKNHGKGSRALTCEAA